LNRLGLVYHQSQKLVEAEQFYREAVKQNPYYLEALNNIGTVHYVRKDYDRAMEQYMRALKDPPRIAYHPPEYWCLPFRDERYEEVTRATSEPSRSIRRLSITAPASAR